MKKIPIVLICLMIFAAGIIYSSPALCVMGTIMALLGYFSFMNTKDIYHDKELKKRLHHLYPVIPKNPSRYCCLSIEISQKGDYKPLLHTHEHKSFLNAVQHELVSLMGDDSVIQTKENSFVVIKPFPAVGIQLEMKEKISHQRWITNTLSHVLQQLITDYDTTNLFLTRVTIGTAASGIHYKPDTMEELIELSNFTCHTAKQRRLPYLIADDTIRAEMRDLLEFKEALGKEGVLKEFHPFFQPIIDLNSSRVIGCEAYARWQKDSYRIIEAARFKDIAYEMNMLEKIDRVIIEKTFLSINRLQMQHLLPESFFIVLNISSMTILTLSVSEVLELSEQYQIDLSNIEFDIKDRHLESDLMREKLQTFKELGIKIALDAFAEDAFDIRSFLVGEFNTVKLDFSTSLQNGRYFTSKQRKFYESLTEIAEHLSIKVLAKDIEEKYQVSYASSLRIPYAQGNYFLKPLGISGFRDFLRKYRSGMEIVTVQDDYDQIS